MNACGSVIGLKIGLQLHHEHCILEHRARRSALKPPTCHFVHMRAIGIPWPALSSNECKGSMGNLGRVLPRSLHEYSAACIHQRSSTHKQAGHHDHECHVLPAPSTPTARARNPSVITVLQVMRQPAPRVTAVAEGGSSSGAAPEGALRRGRRSSGPRGWQRGRARARSPWRSTAAA